MHAKLILAGLIMTAGVTPLMTGPSATAASPASRPVQHRAATAARVAGMQLLINFDNRESLRPGTRVRDASGRRHNGVVIVQDGGRLAPQRGLTRRGADFPARCRSCGRAIIQVDNAPALNPGRRRFVYGAAVRLSRVQATGGSNLIQKGFFKEAGGQYKLQLSPAGVPSCVVYGRGGRTRVEGVNSVANRRWHRLSCTRTPAGVFLRVDGIIRAHRKGGGGFVSNGAPVRIGGNKIKPANNQYHGDLDTVYVRLLP